MSELIQVDLSDSVATLTLNRPNAANSISLVGARELLDAVKALNHTAVRCVLITGVGKTFCTGGDVKEFSAQGDRITAHLTATADALHAAVEGLTQLNAPVLAAVNGVAAGAGFSLACACDLVLAAESARFTMAYTRIGLSPDGSGTWFIPRLIGQRRALELAITNRVLSAAEALDWGLITRVVPDESLRAEADALARELAAGPTQAYAAARQLINEGWLRELGVQLQRETETIATLGASRDGQEGMRAFVEKRAPRFQGR
jgi:2-(1,2-epoxy-1,2-dihydrophenyl)acetyl-CoA isomerase